MNYSLYKLTALIVLISFIGISGTAQLSPNLEQQLNNTPDTEKIDVIIQTNGANQQAAKAVKNAGGNVNKKYSIIDGVAVTIPKVAARNIAERDFVERVDPDFEMSTVLDSSTSQINAEEAWSENATGEEVDVAVLDTGIAESHGSLDVENQFDFTGEGTGDGNGHGTHVAGTIASTDDSYTGVSYDADIHSLKVLTSDGTGSASDVIEGIEYAADNNLDVISLSLGAPVDQCDGEDSLSEAINNAYSQGTVPVVAAGNEGSDSETITVPGCAEDALTVGSVSGDNSISSFSSRGPTADGRVKPDVVAPGEAITSTWNDGEFTSKSGTSMATPHVSGTSAILLAENTSLTPSQVKSTIMETANDLGEDENAQGSGLVDVYDSYHQVETEENTTENTTEENQTTGNQAPSIESLGVNTVEVNGSLEAEIAVNATDQDNETLNVTFYFEGQQKVSEEGYGELSFTESNLSTNTTYKWSAEASDGINTTSTGTQEFKTGVLEDDEEENETDENQTTNKTKPDLPPQASDTARKARMGFFNPTSPFYGFDVAFDNAAVAVGIKSKEAVMEERAQEAKAMAERGNTKAAEKAIKNLRKSAGNDENASKEASDTLEKAIQSSPEEAKKGLRNALENVEKERKQGKPQNPSQKPETNKSGQNERGSMPSNDSMERKPEENSKGDTSQKEGSQADADARVEAGSKVSAEAGKNSEDKKKGSQSDSMNQGEDSSNAVADAEGSAKAGAEADKGNTGAEPDVGAEADAGAKASTGNSQDSPDSNEESSDTKSSQGSNQDSSESPGTTEEGSDSADGATSKTSGSQSNSGADKGSQDTSSDTKSSDSSNEVGSSSTDTSSDSDSGSSSDKSGSANSGSEKGNSGSNGKSGKP